MNILNDLPKRSTPPSKEISGPTDKQKDFILSLLDQLGREVSSLDKPIDQYTVPEASTMIDSLLKEKQSVASPTERSLTLSKPTITGRIPHNGIYTVVFGDEHLTIRFHTGREGRWKGVRIVKFLRGPDNTSDYTAFGNVVEGGIRIWHRFESNRNLADAITCLLSMDNNQQAGAGYRYALESSNCYRCNRTLTVPASIHRGLGPVCAGVVDA